MIGSFKRKLDEKPIILKKRLTDQVVEQIMINFRRRMYCIYKDRVTEGSLLPFIENYVSCREIKTVYSHHDDDE